MLKRKLPGRLLWASLFPLLPACGRAPGETAAPPSEKVARVQVVKPERGDVARRVALPATVRADFEVKLHAKANGYVQSIVKDRGDRVRKDEVIATLDIPEVAQERESAKAAFKLEDATVQRLDAIWKAEKTAVTVQDLDVARAKRDMAAAALKRLDALVGYAEVRAPFDGVVTERFVDPGALVQAGPVVTVVDLSKVRVIVDVPEPDVRLVAVGTPADVRLDALPGRAFPTKVARASSSLDPGTRTLRAELEVSNSDGAILPGMYASVSLVLERHADALALPAKAIQSEQGKPCVFVVAEGKAHKVAVSLGIDDGVRTEVTSGLAGDESVILPGRETPTDGMRVEALTQ